MPTISTFNSRTGYQIGASVNRGTQLPTTNNENGVLFHLTQTHGQYRPGLYLYDNGWVNAATAGGISAIQTSTGLAGGGTYGNIVLSIDFNTVASKQDLDSLADSCLLRSGGLLFGSVNMQYNSLYGLQNPTQDSEAAPKIYVDTQILGSLTNYLPKTGGTITGPLSVTTDPTIADHVATKRYVDTMSVGIKNVFDSTGVYATEDSPDTITLHLDYSIVATKSQTDDLNSTKLNRSGDTMTGPLSMSSNKITNVGYPTDPTDAATKDYVTYMIGAVGINTIPTSFSVSDADFIVVSDLESTTTKRIAPSYLKLSSFSNDSQFITSDIVQPIRVSLPGSINIIYDNVTSYPLLHTTATRGVAISSPQGATYRFAGNNGAAGDMETSILSNTSQSAFRTIDASANSHTIFTNYTSWASKNEYVFDAGAITINGAIVWTASNDGPGSGLNADTLDNYHGGYYLDYDNFTNKPDLTLKLNTAGGTMTGDLLLVGNPPAALSAAPKQYVDTMLPKSGGTMTGDLLLVGNPPAALSAAPKQYVDSMLSKSGGTMTGTLLLNADPVAGMAAATKQYVDSIATGLRLVGAVRVATTANITLSGVQTIDTIALSVGDRVLVKDQSTLAQNGIYVVSAGAWTRATDVDSASELASGCYCFVNEGTVNMSTGWVQSTTGLITVNTTSIVFSKFAQSFAYTFTNGLVAVGQSVSFDTTFGDNRYSLKSSAETYYTRTTDFTAVAGGVYFVNTTNNIVNVTLPAAPSIGHQVTIIDMNSTFATNKCTILFNVDNIMGLTQNMDITNNYASVTLIYSGNSTTGWRIRH